MAMPKVPLKVTKVVKRAELPDSRRQVSILGERCVDADKRIGPIRSPRGKQFD